MIELQRLSTSSFAEALELWNEGFKGYAVDMTLSLDAYLARLHNSGISTEQSLVARFSSRPVGFLLNAIRTHAGRRVAWNGGTGVIPEFRGRGVGRALVERALQIYETEKVDYATLEAISTNASAIALYESCGYETVAELTFLQHEGKLESRFDSVDSVTYSIEEVPAVRVSLLEFYEAFVPWQAHWQSVNDNGGQGLIVYDSEHSPVGYALYRQQFDDNGYPNSITLHQCAADPSRPDTANIISCALSRVFASLSVECARSTHNFNKSNQLAINLLEHAGFKTSIEQVWMKRNLTL